MVQDFSKEDSSGIGQRELGSADKIKNIGQRSRNIYNNYADKAWKHTGAGRDDLQLDIETLVLVEGVETDAVDEWWSNSSADTSCWDQEGIHTDYVQ